MFIGQKGLDIIKEFEGCILRSYDDYNDKVIGAGESYKGTLTIGYGHIEGVYAGQEISQQEADDMLTNDMHKYCDQVNELVEEGVIGFPLTQNMYDALVSFDYNLGQGNLRTLCQNRDKVTVADKMLLYINPGSVWSEGLLKRRKAERALFLTGGDPDTMPPTFWNGYNMGRVMSLQTLLNGLGIRDQNGNTLDVDGQLCDGSHTEYCMSKLPIAQYENYHNDAYTDWIQSQLNIPLNQGHYYDENTAYLVRMFQLGQGITADGKVGMQTLKRILTLE